MTYHTFVWIAHSEEEARTLAEWGKQLGGSDHIRRCAARTLGSGDMAWTAFPRWVVTIRHLTEMGWTAMAKVVAPLTAGHTISFVPAPLTVLRENKRVSRGLTVGVASGSI